MSKELVVHSVVIRLSLLGGLATLLIVDVTLSLAGRNTLLLQLLPWLSFHVVAAILSLAASFYGYILIRLFNARRLFLFFMFCLFIFSEIATCFIIFERMSQKSYDEAREVALNFLDNPRTQSVAYGKGIDEEAIVLPKGTTVTVDPIYAFSPYGVYSFAISLQEHSLFIIQVRSNYSGYKLFVHLNNRVRPTEEFSEEMKSKGRLPFNWVVGSTR